MSTAPGTIASPDLGGAGALFLFDERPPRDDEVLAAFLELDDPEFVDAAFVLGRVGATPGVDLRERAEGALARDAHFVSALHRALDLAFDGQTGLKRVLELPRRRGSERQRARERQPAHGRHHHRLDAVAGGDLEVALGVPQFANLDRGLALAADVHERHRRADGHDGALDRLTLLEALRLERRFEHRRKIFLGLAHNTLLSSVTFLLRLPRGRRRRAIQKVAAA